MSDRVLLQQAFDAMSYGNTAEREAARIALRERLAQQEQPPPHIHSCSYYCDRPECIKAQRDQLRERLAQPEHHELQAKGEHPAPCARHCEATAFQIVIKNLQAQLAQPVQSVAGYCKKIEELIAERDELRERLAQPEQLAQLPQGWSAVQVQGTKTKVWPMTEAQVIAASLAQPEQEPVAWMYHGIRHDDTPHERPSLIWKPEYMDVMSAEKGAKAIPLYTTPPQRKPLTDEECDELWEKQTIRITHKFSARQFIRDVEAAHDIKGKA